MMKRALMLVVLIFGGEARAKVTAVIATPTSPTLGTVFQVRTIDDGKAPAPWQVTFAYQISIPGYADGPWKSTAGAITARLPGKYSIFCEVVYIGGPNGTYSDVFTTSANVGPATASRVVSGVNTSVPYWQTIEVGLLALTSIGGAPVGPYTGDTVISRIVSGTFNGAPYGPTAWGDGWGADIQFSPANIYSAWNFTMNSVTWNNLAYAKFMVGTQEFQIWAGFWDEDNVQHAIVQQIGSHALTGSKTGTVMWMLWGS